MGYIATRRTIENLLWLGAGVVVGWSTKRWVSWAHGQLLQWLWPVGPLKLERPLVTFDIESTGTSVTKDKIVEIAAIKLMPDGTIQIKGPQRLNPGVPLSEEVTAIHGITDADVADCPRFADVAQEWRDFMADCDLHGFNAKRFDVPLLRNEFKRCGIHNFPPLGVPVVDSFRIFCQNEPRTLAAAVQFYCGRQQQTATAHSALADAQNTLDVLIQQVRRYPNVPKDVGSLAHMCAAPSRAQDVTGDGKFQWRGDIPVLAFGKYAGEPLAALITFHKDYLRWMSGQDFSDESLIVVAQALKGLLPTKSGGWEPLVFETSQQQQQQQQQQRQQLSGTAGESSHTQQQQQQELSGSYHSSGRGGNAGGSSCTGSSSTNARQQQPKNQQQETGAAHTKAAKVALSSSFAATPAATAAAVPGSIGWGDLPAVHSSSTAVGNSDSWAAAGSSSPVAAVASSGADAAAEGGSSPDDWSIVDRTLDPLSTPLMPTNPGPQHVQQEGSDGAHQQSLREGEGVPLEGPEYDLHVETRSTSCGGLGSRTA